MKISLKVFSLLLCLMMLLSVCSCNGRSAGPLIDETKSEFDDLFSEINKPSDNKLPAEEIKKQEPKEYFENIRNSYETFTVNINANVEIPDAKSFSVYSVRQKPFTQEFVDNAISVLFKDRSVYNGMALEAMDEVNYYRNSIEQTGSNVMKGIYREYMNNILSGFLITDKNPSVSSFVTDCKLKSVNELYKSNSFYDREYNMYQDGEYLSIATDGSDGFYAYMEIANSIRNSNTLEFISNKLDFLSPRHGYLSKDKADALQKEAESGGTTKPENLTENVGDITNRLYIPLPGESCTLPEGEAQKKAEALLDELGITDFKCAKSKKTKETLFIPSGISVYRTAYEFTFLRDLDGIFLTQAVGTKNNLAITDPDGGGFGKKHWDGEEITVSVNDDGIVGFIYRSPLEITEIVSENVKIKTFDEIKELFRSFVSTIKGSTGSRNIDRVSLGYSRISEGTTNYETGIIVPVWGFYDGDYCRYVINAIDGTIITPSLGYY